MRKGGRWDLGYVPSVLSSDKKKIHRAGIIYIDAEGVASGGGYNYIMPLSPNLTRDQLRNKLEPILGRLPILGADGAPPQIKVREYKHNPRNTAVSKKVISVEQPKTRDLQKHATYYFALENSSGDDEIVSMKSWLNTKVPLSRFAQDYQQSEMKNLLLHKAKNNMEFGRLMDFNRIKNFENQMQWFYDNDIRVTKRGISSRAYDRRNNPKKQNPHEIRENPNKEHWEKRPWGYLGVGIMKGLEIAENADARSSGGNLDFNHQRDMGVGRYTEMAVLPK